jgi:hypothetical protein
MNDSMSILLATSILALGGLGLYVYKSSDDNKKGGSDEEYNEESIFGGNFWSLSDDKNENDEKLDDNLEEFDIYKPRRKNVKTQRNRKSTGISKRRY